MRTITRFAALCVFGMLFLIAPAFASAETNADTAPLTLDIATSKNSYAPGELIELKYTVTNRGTTPCRLAAVPDGTVFLTSVTRDGNSVPRETRQVDYRVGFDGMIRGSLQTVPSNGRAEFTDTAVASEDPALAVPLSTVSPLPTNDALTTSWRLDGPGKYLITAGYVAPQVDGDGPARCPGVTGIASVEINVTGSDRFPWLVIAGAAVVLVGVIVLFVVIRRGRRVTVAAVLTLAAALGAQLSPVPVADAAGMQGATLSGCLAIFNGPNGDPADIMRWMNKALERNYVNIVETKNPNSDNTEPKSPFRDKDGNPLLNTGSTITWNPNDRSPVPNEPGVFGDPCGNLYHEMVHAHDRGVGNYDDKPCAGMPEGSTLTYKEVKATLYENLYRRSHFVGVGLAERTHYGFDELPKGETVQAALDKCRPPEKDPPDPPRRGGCGIPRVIGRLSGQPLLDLSPGRNARARSRAKQEGGDCAASNGDPHLTTFDQLNYDLQAVGEFLAAKAGDLEVQTRQEPVPLLRDRTVSVNSAVAMRVGSDRVGFYVENGEIVVHLNGQTEAIPSGKKKLAGGGTITRGPGPDAFSPDGYTVAWPNGFVADLDIIGTWGIRLLLSPNEQQKEN
jgi:hypothetical protein